MTQTAPDASAAGSAASTYRLPGLLLTDHVFTVPLDHDAPAGEQIGLFVRDVAAPDGPPEALITGGLPGVDVGADDVYRAAYRRVLAKNSAHYARYPGDASRARLVAAHLRDHTVRLPGGGQLTVEAFQALGNLLGMSTGSHKLH